MRYDLAELKEVLYDRGYVFLNRVDEDNHAIYFEARNDDDELKELKVVTDDESYSFHDRDPGSEDWDSIDRLDEEEIEAVFE